MPRKLLNSAWSEKIAYSMEEEFDNKEFDCKPNPRLRRSFNSFENENLFNSTTVLSDNALTPNAHLTDNNNTYQRRTRNNEIDCDTQNLTLSHTPSSDTLYSRGSRNISRRSPPGSYRSIRSSMAPYPTPSPLIVESNTTRGVNIIMMLGLAIGIAFDSFLNITEVCLNWFQIKIKNAQLHFFAGRSIQEFYTQEESIARKIVFCPLSVLLLILQFTVYGIIVSIGFLKKPAPKALVSNVLKRYVNE